MATAAEYESIIKSLQWDALRSLWDNIEKRNTPDWESGKAFEYLIIRAFELDGAEVRYPYNVRLFEEEIEQIDGAIHISEFSCLVESKDFADKKVDIAPIAKLRNQLLRRPTATVGLVFSRTGFTDPARTLSRFLSPHAILLWDGNEIEYALDNQKICELLILKYRVCIEDGLPDYNVTTRNIP
ncbi:restriction endonuclease [Phormidium tenue]|uniref:Restriction endonuclease n=1 Tax=Phormidium tenue FACHB-1050 TaxID=2692857 RepID=A0ABR8C425_9CYAN|nr:restriction endonuclease [Phormidium tenue]MBD2315311.1 restriction endonuclease [Phormidium tenue FACHB-1050]